MNPGIGLPELFVIVVLAIVFVGPRDLPLMVRRVGQFMGKVRGVARDFQRSFDELGREAELDELRKEIDALKKANPINEVKREFQSAEAEAMRASEDRPHPRANPDLTPKPILNDGEPLTDFTQDAPISDAEPTPVASADETSAAKSG